jgi:hypothetical protein
MSKNVLSSQMKFVPYAEIGFGKIVQERVEIMKAEG